MLSKRSRVLVTGATGFVGQALCQTLLQQGYFVRAVGRKEKMPWNHAQLEYHQLDEMNEQTDWQNKLDGVDVVVHLAARVHHIKDKGMQQLAAYQEINVKGTRQLAKAAIKSQVKRYIYLSTIKVNGEQTFDMPFRAEEQPRPQDAYSLSKLQGEQVLQEESKRSGMEWVIIRSPLVYGPKVQGNFRRLMRLAKSYLPLPLATVKNARSYVNVVNLCDFISCCLTHPNAQGETFLVSDDQDLSTPQLIRMLRKTLGRRSGLFPFPQRLLKFLAVILGRRREINRMLGSLQINIKKSKRLLNWKPPLTVEQALALLWEEEQVKMTQPEVNPMPLEQQS